MFKIILQNGMKINIWIGKGPIEKSNDYSKLILEGKTKLYADAKKIIIELFIPQAHNNYALLGVDFSSTNHDKVQIKSSLSKQDKERYSKSMALPIDAVFWGIIDEFEDGIICSVKKHIKAQTLPSGIIDYNVSAYGEIGSSSCMFESASDILLSLLMYAEINEENVRRVISNVVLKN